jgi:uncharacterized Tic20 family protein
MAYCASCNKEVKTGKFCHTCGKQLVDQPAAGFDSITETTSTTTGTGSQLAMWSHLAPLLGAVACFIIVVSGFLLWLPGLIIRNSAKATAFDKRHATESLNFQLSLLLFVAVLVPVSFLTIGLGALLYVPLGIMALVFNIMAIVAANQGNEYRYPISIRFVK